MKNIFGVILISSFLSTTLWASSEPAQAKTIIFENSKGRVILKHLEHSVLKGVKCIACHHKYIRAKPAACTKCHPTTVAQKIEKFSSVLRKDALHKCCINCHKMTSENSPVKPPVACEECHEQDQSKTSSK